MTAVGTQYESQPISPIGRLLIDDLIVLERDSLLSNLIAKLLYRCVDCNSTDTLFEGILSRAIITQVIIMCSMRWILDNEAMVVALHLWNSYFMTKCLVVTWSIWLFSIDSFNSLHSNLMDQMMNYQRKIGGQTKGYRSDEIS